MAIIGNGDIAKALKDRKGAIFFASGVSNSSCRDEYQFAKESKILLAQPRDKCLFYFSTISRYYSWSPYIEHKKRMETLVQQFFENFNIIRIGNIDWGINPHTFLNALQAKKAKGEPFEIFEEFRYMISKNELLLLTNNLPLTGKNEINAFGRMALVKNLL